MLESPSASAAETLEPIDDPTSAHSDLSELATGTGIALVGRATGRVIDLTRQAVLVRLISQADFGIYALALTVFRLVTMFASVGQSGAVIRFGAERRHNPAQFGAVLRVAVGLALTASTIFCVLLFTLAEPIAILIFDQPELALLLRIFAIVLPLWSLMDVCLAATMIDRRIAFAIAAEEIVQPILYLLLLIFLVVLSSRLYAVQPIEAAVWAALLSFGVIAFLALWVMMRRYPAFRVRAPAEANRGLTLTMGRYGTPLALASLLLWSSPLLDRLLMGVFSTPENAGTFIVIAQLSTFFTLIAAAIDLIQGPITAHLIYGGDTARLEHVTQSAVRIGLLLGIPGLIVLCFHGNTVLTVVFGADYAIGASALAILCAAMLLRVISDRAIGLLVMSGYNRRWLIFSSAFSALNVALDALLIPRWGMVGSALGTVIVNIFLLIALERTTATHLQVRLFNVSFLWFMPIALVSAGIGLLPFWLGLRFSDLLDLLVFALLSSGAFALLVWRFALPDDEKALLTSAFEQLTQRVKGRGQTL